MDVDEPPGTPWASASERIDRFLKVLVETCDLQLTYELTTGSERDGIRLGVNFAGGDAQLLTARNAELLHALEVMATSILRLAPEEHDLLSFDAEGYKEGRAQQMRRLAEIAVATVKTTGRPYAFRPMNSRERRMLHLQLKDSGLRTASSGEASRRFVVLYPPAPPENPEETPAEGGANRAHTVRNAFRPR